MRRGGHFQYGRPPAKGTALRAMLLLAMRPQGVTNMEAEEEGLPGKQLATKFGTKLLDEKGYDLRCFRCEKHRAHSGCKNNTNAWAWRLVGKWRWDGSYRSFIDPAQNRPALSRRAG